MEHYSSSFSARIWRRFRSHILGVAALAVVILFCLVAIYAPFLASGKPFVVRYDGQWFFPLFRYLFYKGYYTKNLDLFFNVMIFTFPLFIVATIVSWKRPPAQKRAWAAVVALQLAATLFITLVGISDPASDSALSQAKRAAVVELGGDPNNWNFDLSYMNSYHRLNLLLNFRNRQQQHLRLQQFKEVFANAAGERWLASEIPNQRAALLREGVAFNDLPDEDELKQMILKNTPADIISRKTAMPTLWNRDLHRYEKGIKKIKKKLNKMEIKGERDTPEYHALEADLDYRRQQRLWLQNQSQNLEYIIEPLLRTFHWEEDAGGQQILNRYISWWELTRINRKDMLAALIFGVRISLIVGIAAVGIAMMIGIPIGAAAGYYGGKLDILVSRMLEVWEAMPVFFMLLLVVAITQSKSIFLIIMVIGLFNWTTFSRYIRGEFFKQRNLSYVEACYASGFGDRYVIFSHILPNAVPPVLTLLPFAIMSAITSEAGLSFLGLGEEGSCSWGVLMDEGRSAFPGESYLLWPPAILLTTLLIAIALVGDALRDALDPKSTSSI